MGERLATLALHIIVAMFFATFDEAHLCDSKGREALDLPPMDLEAWISGRPKGGNACIKVKRMAEPARVSLTEDARKASTILD